MTSLLYKVRARFRTIQNRENYADYFEIVIKKWRQARRARLYYTKLALEENLVELGFAAQRLGFDAKAIAQERGFARTALGAAEEAAS